MRKVKISIVLCFLLFLTSCMPSFPEATVDASNFFNTTVYYTTFVLDMTLEEGIKIEPELTEDIDVFIDENEENVPYRAYKTISFKTDTDATLTYLFFSITATANCTLQLALT